MKRERSILSSSLSSFSIIISCFSLIFFSCTGKEEKDEPAKPPVATDSITRSNTSFIKDCKVFERRARTLDSTLMQELEINKQTANQAIHAFTEFADYCHDDSLAPIYYLKTAQVARAIENIPVAKQVLERCLQNFPSYKGKPAVLFFLAQLYDEPSYLNNEQEAKRLYQLIIDEYPRSEWAMSARGAITFIGKTDEEMIEEFERRNKQK